MAQQASLRHQEAQTRCSGRRRAWSLPSRQREGETLPRRPTLPARGRGAAALSGPPPSRQREREAPLHRPGRHHAASTRERRRLPVPSCTLERPGGGRRKCGLHPRVHWVGAYDVAGSASGAGASRGPGFGPCSTPGRLSAAVELLSNGQGPSDRHGLDARCPVQDLPAPGAQRRCARGSSRRRRAAAP